MFHSSSSPIIIAGLRAEYIPKEAKTTYMYMYGTMFIPPRTFAVNLWVQLHVMDPEKLRMVLTVCNK